MRKAFLISFWYSLYHEDKGDKHHATKLVYADSLDDALNKIQSKLNCEIETYEDQTLE